jgi:hypothetical protein
MAAAPGRPAAQTRAKSTGFACDKLPHWFAPSLQKFNAAASAL